MSFVVHREDLFPVGTSVAAYLVVGRGETPGSGAPSGAAAETQTVASDGKLTFTALTDGKSYILYAGSPDRYLRVNTSSSPSLAGSGSASGVENVNAVATAGASQTLPDVDTATVHRLTLTSANCTITFPTAAAGHSFTVVLVQDATGGRTVTWPGTVLWGGGSTPTLTTTAAKRDVFSFLCADGTNWLGMYAGQNL